MKANFRTEIDEHGNRVLVEVQPGRARPVIKPAGKVATEIPRSDPLLLVPEGRSIKLAGEALQSMFEAVVKQGAIDMTATAKASGAIIDAIDGIGFGSWLGTVRSHHKGTYQHCLLVTGVASSFGLRNKMRRPDIERLTVGALLHDIGKAKIPLAILDKPAKLDPAEEAIIQQHPVFGFNHLRQQGDVPDEILSMVRHHHEFLDGSGYPDGLTSHEINDVTRILTICDIYGALIEERPYKPAKSRKEAIAILLALAEQGKVEKSLVGAL